MEIGDGMGPGSTVATNKLLRVCWRRQVCIGLFQWPCWSREGQAACCYREGGCVWESDGLLIWMQGWVNSIQCAHWFPALTHGEMNLLFARCLPFFFPIKKYKNIFPIKKESKRRVLQLVLSLPPYDLCALLQIQAIWEPLCVALKCMYLVLSILLSWLALIWIPEPVLTMSKESKFNLSLNSELVFVSLAVQTVFLGQVSIFQLRNHTEMRSEDS